ncbi:MAG: SurA N-terminal domain-containing protein [Paludibacteraceae bacterium]|nr:SurA N-terminal domain-containing protein [Paludibacteraceae bacterium]
MATLEKIRQRGVLLTCIIGFALILFIFTGVDFNTLFGESRTLVGEVNGNQIEIAEFEKRYDEAQTFFQVERGVSSLDEQTAVEVRNIVWNTWLREQLYGEACEELGIVVTEDELVQQIVGEHPNPMLSNLRMLYNPEKNGFDKDILLQLLNAIDEDPTSDYAKYWAYVERNIRLQLLENKYNAMVATSINYNNVDAQALYDAKKAANIEYVFTPYTTQADSLYSASDKEIETYYKNNLNKYYQQKEQRVIKLLSYPIVPSADDFAETQKWMDDLKNDFATSADFIAISNQNSDVVYNGIAVSKQKIDADLKDFAFAGKKDDVFGPTLLGDTYKMARLVETGIMAPDSIQARHILVQDSDAEKTQALADSLVGLIKGGADFAALAKEFSLAGTAQNGGDLGWFTEGDIDVDFSKACFAAKKNEVFTYPMGTAIQIVQVTEQTKPVEKVLICVLQRKVEAGSQTYGRIYNDASQYIAKNTTQTAFQDSARAENGLFLRTYTVSKDDNFVGTLENSRQIIRWAFDNDPGVVADQVFECGNNFVVVVMDQVIPQGEKSLDMVKMQVKLAVLQDKKADAIIATMKASGDNLAALGDVKTATNVSLSSSFIPNVGREPMLSACIPALIESNQIQYVKGNMGVYAVKLQSVVPQAAYDAAAEIQDYSNRNPFVYTTFESLKNSADIVDNRINFY